MLFFFSLNVHFIQHTILTIESSVWQREMVKQIEEIEKRKERKKIRKMVFKENEINRKYFWVRKKIVFD